VDRKRSGRWSLAVAWLLVGAPTSAHAQVFASEFFADPVSEGWDLIQQYCEPTIWNADGWYYQQLSLVACPPGPQGGHDSYRRSLEAYNGTPQFFVEFRLRAEGDRSQIPFGGPALLATGNFFGVSYHVTIARDLVKFLRDVDLPIWFIEIEPNVPHIYRIELHAKRYAFYIDAYLIDEGIPEGPFPAHDSVITWQGNSWQLPCHNAWDYIRYGRSPSDGSGDYDSDGALTLLDHYFVHDCLTKDGPGMFGGPEQDCGPGCRFADCDGDSDTDLLDFAEFQNVFTGE